MQRGICLIALTTLMACAASGTAVYATPADFDGTRSIAGGGLEGTGSWTSGKSLTWEIDSLGPDSWRYTYTFSGFASPGISHMILDLTDDCVGTGGKAADAGCVTEFAGDTEFSSYNGSQPSNPGLPGTIVGVKFDEGQNTYTFVSNRAPVWGDIYVKGGSNSGVWNAGIDNHASENTNDFVARPNGSLYIAETPEPGSIALMGVGLVVLGFFGQRKRGVGAQC